MPTRVTRLRYPVVQQASVHQHSIYDIANKNIVAVPAAVVVPVPVVPPPLVPAVLLPASLLLEDEDEQQPWINTDTTTVPCSPHNPIYNKGPPPYSSRRPRVSTSLHLPASLLGDDSTTNTSSTTPSATTVGSGTTTRSYIIANTSAASTSNTSISTSSTTSINPLMLDCSICEQKFIKVRNTVIPECQHRFCIGCVNYLSSWSFSVWNNLSECYICRAKIMNNKKSSNGAGTDLKRITTAINNEQEMASRPLPSSAREETNQIYSDIHPLDLQQTVQEPVCTSSVVIDSSKRKVQVSNYFDDDSPITSIHYRRKYEHIVL